MSERGKKVAAHGLPGPGAGILLTTAVSGQATEHGRRKRPPTSAEKASPDTEKEQRVLEVGRVQHQRQRLILENRHFKRQFPVPDCISLFSTNSLPLPPHGSPTFEFPNFMMSELCFNVY